METARATTPAPRDVDREDLAGFMDELVGVDSGRYTRNEAAVQAGVDVEDGRRSWRAMGSRRSTRTSGCSPMKTWRCCAAYTI